MYFSKAPEILSFSSDVAHFSIFLSIESLEGETGQGNPSAKEGSSMGLTLYPNYFVKILHVYLALTISET